MPLLVAGSNLRLEMARQQPSLRVSLSCPAGPGEVYDVLADLQTHLEWGGTRQPRSFRVLSLAAPPSAAIEGTVFTSTGSQPMSKRRWEDRSTVTVADRPRAFEFVTEGTLGERNPMTGRYQHRFEIAPEAAGSRITYTVSQLAVANPTLRYSLPVLRQLVWRIVFPKLSERGLRNLFAYIDEHATRNDSIRPSAGVGDARLPAPEA
ncbi:MAG TPA: SRPBCC family protein [Candidatus Dormibacteraeota bacterium]